MILAFIARGSSYGGTICTWITNAEIYPTRVRSSGHSMASTMTRIGAICSSFVVNSNLTDIQKGLCFCIANLMCVIAIYFLPETAGN
jgi:hypothetical protein